MASLGLKIYYLRTREKRLKQSEVAKTLGVRQGTLSYIENDITSPQLALLLSLSEFFDVTPTFLADPERGVVPRPTERWGLRNSLVTLGMFVEVSEESVVALGDGRRLCRIGAGDSFFDAEAAAARTAHGREADAQRVLEEFDAARAAEERELEQALAQERERHPRRRG